MEHFRAIQTGTNNWVYGFYVETKEGNAYLITEFSPGKVGSTPVQKETVGKFTGKYDIHKRPLYQGDIIISNLNGVAMTIHYGEYETFCPADNEYMANVGFYVSADHY